MMNELVVMTTTYMTVGYTDFQPDFYLKYNMGWGMAMIFATCFVGNIFAIIYKVIKTAI
jgi:hypothetical protein